MSVTLNLGVVDVAYSDANGSGATTTFKVAQILESNYKVMQTFFFLRREKIAGFLADDMAAQIQRLVTGQRVQQSGTLTFGADQKIEAEFRAFIFADEMSKLEYAVTGQALSEAAARGVNHRRKMPYSSKNKPRVAFVDTGLYVASFRAWTTKTADVPVGAGT